VGGKNKSKNNAEIEKIERKKRIKKYGRKK